LIAAGGTTNFATDAGGTLGVTVNASGTANFSATQHLASLVVNTGGAATVNQNGSHALVVSGAFDAVGTGRLDLKDNKLIVRNGSLSTIESRVASGRAGGTWGGGGIVTSMPAAGTANQELTTLGVALASSILNFSGNATVSWSGESVGGNDVLVKYTYAGDADLNGKINGDDYFFIDSGFADGRTGYSWGDFDHSGAINSGDYFLIDSNYLRQGPPLVPTLSALTLAAVPEPPPLVLIMFGVTALLQRRRKAHP
jgi:hypothetical protein